MGQVVVLQVTGMDCAVCERRLQTVLGRLDGVGQVDADHSIGQVRVRFDAARTNAAALTRRATERIEQAGFDVTGTSEEATS